METIAASAQRRPTTAMNTRGRSYSQPGFHNVRRAISDHPDSALFDEYDEHYHSEDEEAEDHNAQPGNDSERLSTQSDQTLQDPTAAHSARNDVMQGTAVPQAKDGLSAAEKGKNNMRRRRADSKGPPETREWPDNVVAFDNKADPQNPKNWSPRRKTVMTMLFGLSTMSSTFASSVYSPAIPYVGREFGISSEVGVLGISLFVLGYVPGPVIFAPTSELYGRLPSVLVPLFIFACFSAATATADNIQTIFITRFFAGLFASAPVASVGGALADMYDQRQRGTAVVFYSLAVVAGPTIGPVVGAAVAQSKLGWRWTEYLSVILTCTILILDLIFLTETFAPVILTRKARQLRWKTKRWALHSKQEETPYSLKSFMTKNLLLPLKMIVQEPMVTCITVYNSFAYGILYLLFAAVPIVFEEGRGWNTLVGSLPFLAVLIGCVTAAALNILYSTLIFAKHLDAHDGRAEPEMRLPPMCLGAILFPIGFFLLGWTSDPSIHWFPSVLGLYFIGVAFLLIFQSGINYLIDAYTRYSASAVAANTFLRSIFAAALPLVAQPLFHNLGIGFACTLLGCIAAALAVVPFVFYVYGRRLRSKSRLVASL